MKNPFKRKPKGPPRLAECPRETMKREACGLCSLQYVCDDPGKGVRMEDNDLLSEAVDQAFHDLIYAAKVCHRLKFEWETAAAAVKREAARVQEELNADGFGTMPKWGKVK